MTSKSFSLHSIPTPAPLVEVWRGPLIESRHRGHIVAVENDARVVAQLGAPDTVAYLRSSAKPHQAVPLIVSGAAERFGLTDAELAVACGSHSGEPVHVETVANLLRRLGLDHTALRCGTHEPFNREAALKLKERGAAPDALHHNCSGKHAGMLALALHLGAPIESYFDRHSPVQQTILGEIARFSATRSENIAIGVDGCGVPVFGVRLASMALMYARLISPPGEFPEEIKTACQRLVAAMNRHPEMVGGTSERLDTEVMRATRGQVISKVGAEGVYTAGIKPSERWPRGLGFAMKIEDGEDRRARPTVVIESLRQLGVLSEEAVTALARYATFPVKNNKREIVGQVRPEFELEFGGGSKQGSNK